MLCFSLDVKHVIFIVINKSLSSHKVDANVKAYTQQKIANHLCIIYSILHLLFSKFPPVYHITAQNPQNGESSGPVVASNRSLISAPCA